MTSNASKALIFLAFANDRAAGGRYLRNLPEEQRRVRQELERSVAAGHCEVVERSNATLDELQSVLVGEDSRDRLAVFHFGGHGGSWALMLEADDGSESPAHAEGLAELLGSRRGMTLAFFNGCSTRAQARYLLDRGVPAAIVTSEDIDDRVATEFAVAFYRSLAAGATVPAAFDEARAGVQTGLGKDSRSAYREESSSRSFVPRGTEETTWPWELHVRAGSEEALARWSLPLAAEDPLFGLPPLPETDLPATPFKHLEPFTEADAEVFFGRGAEIRQLFEALTVPGGTPVVLLFGGTGVGKSSLLHAGLVPRLGEDRQVLYRRRDPRSGLHGTLREVLGGGASVAAAWKEHEEAEGRPLVVILDQFEEAYCKPIAKASAAARELPALAEALESLFGRRATRPRGRLVLAFRKEWLQEVRRFVLDAGLPVSLVEVRRLAESGIEEAVAGPASSRRLQERYKLHLDPKLPAMIADDLLEDPDAPVAPALQILLSKMWCRAEKDTPASPAFSLELYSGLKREGLLLEDFLDEQLRELRSWKAEAVGSGLVLDLLSWHITSLNTAETRPGAETLARYGHVAYLPELLDRCRELRLLAGTLRYRDGALVPLDGDSKDLGASRLSHDTLAPLIRHRFETSDRPGQRARRVLEQRAVDWRGGKDGPVLDEADLKLVEQGREGMPLPNPDQERLLEASRRERAGRLSRRRLLRWAAALAVAAVAASSGIAWLQNGQLQERERKQKDSLRVAMATRWVEKDPTAAAGLLAEVSEPELTGSFVGQSIQSLEMGVSELIFYGQEGAVMPAAWSPTGDRIITTSADGTARVWNSDGTGTAVVLQGQKSVIWKVAWSPSGDRVVLVSKDGTVQLWRADGTGAVVKLENSGVVTDVEWSPLGDRVVTASEDGMFRVWRRDGTGPLVVCEHGGTVTEVEWSPSGDRILTASRDGKVRVWSKDGTGPLVELDFRERLKTVAWNPEAKRVLMVSEEGKARLWAEDGTELAVIERGLIGAARWSPSGDRIMTEPVQVNAGSSVIWKLGDSGLEMVAEGSEHGITTAAWSPTGDRVVTGSEDGTARVWRSDGQGSAVELRGHESSIVTAEWSPTGDRIVTTSWDGTARVWRPEGTGSEVVLAGQEKAIAAGDWSPTGDRILAVSEDGVAKVWTSDGIATPVEFFSGKKVDTASWSPSGDHILTASTSHTGASVRVWSADGQEVPELSGKLGGAHFAAWSPSGDRIVTRGGFGSAQVWSLGGILEAEIELPGVRTEALEWSPGGDRIAVRLKWGELYLFEPDGTAVSNLGGGASIARWSPTGDRVVTDGDSSTALVWDENGDGPEAELGVEPEPSRSFRWSPSGDRIAMASWDGSTRVWPSDGKGRGLELEIQGEPEIGLLAEWSPSGEWIATTSKKWSTHDVITRVWRSNGKEDALVLPSEGPWEMAPRWSPAGDYLLAPGKEGKARVWQFDATELQQKIRASTRACLQPDFRETYLAEPAAEAWGRSAACELSFGRCPLTPPPAGAERKARKWIPRRDRARLGECSSSWERG